MRGWPAGTRRAGPEGYMRRIAGGAGVPRAAFWAALLGACAPAPADPPPALEPAIDLQRLRNHSRRYDEYVGALGLCNSESPADWAKAARIFEELHPFRVFGDDPELIRRFRAGDEAARRELGRRGSLLEAQAVFFRSYDPRRWDEARKILLESRPGGPEIFVWTLLQVLLSGQTRVDSPAEVQDVRVHVRYHLVQAGELAREMAEGLARRMAEEIPDTIVSRTEDLAHVMVLLIEFGDPGRAVVEELARHPKKNVRRAAAQAIGEARDAAAAPVLARLLSEDPEWPVRATAAESAGRLGAARTFLGPVLVARLDREPEPSVHRRLLRALGEIHHEAAVPELMRWVDSPRQATSEAAMYALYRITGRKFLRPDEWRDWYQGAHPSEKSLPGR